MSGTTERTPESFGAVCADVAFEDVASTIRIPGIEPVVVPPAARILFARPGGMALTVARMMYARSDEGCSAPNNAAGYSTNSAQSNPARMVGCGSVETLTLVVNQPLR
jgi:hypothetical protein